MSGRAKYLAMGAAALVVALAGGLTLASQVASAQGPGGRGRLGGPGGPGGPMGRGGQMGPGGPMAGPMGGPGVALLMLGRLGLNDSQREQVKQIVDSHKDEQKALGERALAAHEALDEATTADGFDEGALRARAADVAAVEADMAVMHARVYGEVFQILTPDQQSQLKKMQSTLRERQKTMQQKRPRRGQGV